MNGLPPPRCVLTANWLICVEMLIHIRTVHGVLKQNIWSWSRIQELRFWPSEMNCQLDPKWKMSQCLLSLESVTSQRRGPIWFVKEIEPFTQINVWVLFFWYIGESANCTFEVNEWDFVEKTLEASEDLFQFLIADCRYKERLGYTDVFRSQTHELVLDTELNFGFWIFSCQCNR